MFIYYQLQQFRQKKDGKGSSSQGKKKSSKSEQHESDVDSSSAAAKLTESLHPEGESASQKSNLGVVDSNSMENSVASEIDVAAGDMSSEAIIPESGMVETLLACDIELLPQQLGVSDDASSVHNEGESTPNIDAEEARVVPLATIGNPVLDGETKDADMSIGVDLSTSSRVVGATEGGTITVEMDNANRKDRLESLASQEVVPDTSLIQARGYQVTDVGCALLLFSLFSFSIVIYVC